MTIALRRVCSILSFPTMGKRPGRGALFRKQKAQEARYVQKGPEKDSIVGSKPRLLSAANEDDCKFAIKFADGVRNELRKIKSQQEQFETSDTHSTSKHHRTVFGFFGKSTLLVESIRPSREGSSHLSIQLGVPGSGKSTFLAEFLQDVYTGAYVKLTGPRPSLLLASTTNEQCKNLFELVTSESLRDESSVPKATPCVSQEYYWNCKNANDVMTVKNAKEKHHWPRKNNIYVCTHDYATEWYSRS